MTILQFLQAYQPIGLARVIFKDGFAVSLKSWQKPSQIGKLSKEFITFELGYPNTDCLEMDKLNDYRQDSWLIWYYVPIELVEELVQSHGGILGTIGQ